MKSRIHTHKKRTREQTPDFSTAPAQPMFQSRSFVVPSKVGEQSIQPTSDLKTQLRRATRFGHNLSKIPAMQSKAAIGREKQDVQRQDEGEQPENKTGLPDNLKSGVENLSGFSMDDVKVNYNSDKPAQLNALAYAQGSDIHVSPGQEKHLPHEAWHVVQQKQGSVQATSQKQGVAVNEEMRLEREADMMGEKANRHQLKGLNIQNKRLQTQLLSAHSHAPVQMVEEGTFKDDPEDFMKKNVVLFKYFEGLKKKHHAAFSKIGKDLENYIKNNLGQLMSENRSSLSFSLEESGTITPDKKPIYYITPALEKLDDTEVKKLFKLPNNEFAKDAEDLVKTIKAAESRDYIEASYVPYKVGDPNQLPEGKIDKNSFENVGSAVIDPAVTKFVFTDAMNGCAYAITEVNKDEVTKFQAWHFQSETSNWKQASHFRALKSIRDWFGVHDYYIGDGGKQLAATNIIWKKGEGQWNMLSQKNIVPLDNSDPTIFKDSTSTEINVSDRMSPDTYNKKLLPYVQETKGEISKAKTDIQQKVRDFKISRAKVYESLKKLTGSNPEAMTEEEYNAIKTPAAKASKIQGNRIEEYERLVAMNERLENIRKKGYITGWNYDKAGTKSVKQDYSNIALMLLQKITDIAEEAAKTEISETEKEVNEELVKKLIRVNEFHDIYEDWDGYSAVQKIITELEALNTKVEKLQGQEEMYAKEREKVAGPSGGAEPSKKREER